MLVKAITAIASVLAIISAVADILSFHVLDELVFVNDLVDIGILKQFLAWSWFTSIEICIFYDLRLLLIILIIYIPILDYLLEIKHLLAATLVMTLIPAQSIAFHLWLADMTPLG